MKYFPLLAVLGLALTISCADVQAQTNSAPAATTGLSQHTLDKHIQPILQALKLGDADKEAKVRAIMTAQLQALDTWHTANDKQIKALWAQFSKARSKMNETNADATLAQLDAVYATFQPQHDAFLAQLGGVLSPEQIETVEDTLTINKVKITYNAYQQIFHGLTAEQNAVILKNLKAAREQAIDAGSMPEKSLFFKKYKIKMEAYLTTQGYDVKKSYQDFVAKQKAEMASPPAADDKN